ncbi:MAG: CPBP family intramembrane glutamic endopeptidase [Desulfomonilia bacterium]
MILADAVSRVFLEGGALGLIIARQSLQDPLGFILAGCLIGPFAEELFFRGLIYAWLRDRMPVLPAVVVSALLFAGMHGFFSPVQLAGGLLFAGIYEWRKSIWAPWVVHAAGNFGIWALPWILPWW